MGDLVPTSVAAKRLGVSTKTLYRYVTGGKLRPDAVLPSGHWRWDVDRLREDFRALRKTEE